MKKLGQKLSFLTKILLVVGLLISNLSSLSVVFAYEVPTDVVVSLNEETLEIKYNEELAEEVEAVNVIVYEKYAYLDGTFETFGGTFEEVKNVYSLSAEELLKAKEGTLELEYNSIFANEDTDNNFELFDGTYSAKVEIVDVTDYSESSADTTQTVDPETTETGVVSSEIAVVESTETNTGEGTLEGQENNLAVETIDNEGLATGETTVLLSYGTYEEKMIHNSGLGIKVFDSFGVEITKINGKYSLTDGNAELTVVAQILAGGLNPTDLFEYNGEGYFAYELIKEEIPALEKDFSGLLYGDYVLPVEVKVLKQLPEVLEVREANVIPEGYEEVVYTSNVNVLYGTYDLNTEILNSFVETEGFQDTYIFSGEGKNGFLYTFSEFEETTETVVTRTMLDLYKMLNGALGVSEGVEPIITYTLLKDGVNVLESYVPASEEDTIEDYLATVTLDDTVKVELTSGDLTISYRVVVIADFNNDRVVTEDDLLELISQFVGEDEVTDIIKSDLNGNGKVDSLDILELNQVIKNKKWEFDLEEIEATLDSSLEVKVNGELLSEENYLISGDKFSVDYVLSLSDYEVNSVAGLFDYDETLFELISVETSEVTEEWLGNYHKGKFVYFGEESLTGPEEDEETDAPEQTPEDVQLVALTDEEDNSLDYVLVSATFIALKSTNEESNSVITLKELELYNSTEEMITHYQLDKNTVSTEAILVTASDDNTLFYLEVAGVEIALEDGVFEYEINVESDVTVVNLKYILSNIAATITSTVCPEELAEGSNTIVLTVTSETGVSQDYTITVNREKVEKPTTQVNYNNYYGDYEEEEEEVIVTPPVEDETDDNEKEPEKESNLSRIVIIILILLVIAGLVYLIFKDEDDNETKKANKQINKLKKEELEPEVKRVEKTSNNKNTNNNKSNNKNKNNKNKGSKNNKKAR